MAFTPRRLMRGASGAGGQYQISRSLRFNEADSAYLNRTFTSAGNRKTWTWSGWVKRTGPTNPTNAVLPFFGVTNAGNDSGFFVVGALGDVISIQLWNTVFRRTTAVYRDYSAWYHIVVAFDTTQATAANRIKLYVNNVEATSFSFSADPTLNADYAINNNVAHNIFSEIGVGSYELGGYLTEVNFIDGQALTPLYFGETNAQTGVWQPKRFSGAPYGTNGFYLNFSDNSNTTAATLGKDYSPNGNNWTPNNFSVTAGVGNDSVVDTPTPYGFDTGVGGEVRGNYCTLNPLIYRYGYPTITTFSNGNLDALMTSAAVGSYIFGSIFVSSGKWYWETTINAIGNVGGGTGIDNGNKAYDISTGNSYYYSNGSKASNGSLIAYGASYTTGDIIGTAFDADAGTLTFYKNGTSQGVAYTGITGQNCYLGIGENGFSISTNFGQRPFAYTAPSGFKALCTQNLPTPTIGATAATTADKFFAPVTFTSSGTGSITISSLGFQPDFTWWKSRATVVDHYLMDVLRGNSTYLASNRTLADQTYSNIWTPSSSGWTSSNGSFYNNDSNVAWNWKANGAGSTNTAGSITSTVSANPTAGFSVVTWTAGSGAGTVGHGLGATPKMIITKIRSTVDNWYVYHQDIGNTKTLFLDTTNGQLTTTVWNNTSPTSSVFTYFGSNTQTYVAYCFAEVAGYSKFGSYTGNGSADGPFVYTGFRPAYVLAKKSSGIELWFVLDSKRGTYNVNKPRLNANNTDAESTGYDIMDFTSNGFKFRNSDTSWNANGDTYIFAAFAEAPFKYALAR